jgi:very-short-patch-repair endonuclease
MLGAWRFTRDMDRKVATHRRSDAIAEIAARQHGVISAAELYSVGLSEDQVRARVRGGWLHRVHRGVYAVGHRNLNLEGWWMAATLACGQDAVLSHESAAALWEIRRSQRDQRLAGEGGGHPIEVSIPSGSGRISRAGLVVHRVAALLPSERTIHRGIRATTPERTILDLASRLARRQLERAIDEAERLRLCGGCELEAIVATHAGRAGTAALRRVLESHRAGSTVTRSELEERFLALCRKHRLPQPEVNVPLLDYVVDFLWPEARLVVEVDGHASHGTHRAFQGDRDRDGRLAVAGYLVLRFTWWDVTRRPAVVADRLRRLLRVRVEKPGV